MVGRGEDAELEEGVAQFFFDEVNDEGINHHDAAQVYFDPPVVERCLRVGLPEGGWIVVEDVGGRGRIRADAADARAEEVGIDRVPFAVGDDLAFHVAGLGAIDIEDGGLVAATTQLGNGAGVGF